MCQFDKVYQLNRCAFFFLSACLMMFSNAFQPKETIEQKATRIHDSVLTINTHCDTPMNFSQSDYNLAQRHDAKTTGANGGALYHALS
jgi:hypothetical protein